MTTEKPIGLCFRCDHRAIFLETGSGPRCECKDTAQSVCSCYQYRPVQPLLLIKAKDDPRPQFGPSLISSRSRSGGLSEGKVELDVSKAGNTPYWAPKGLESMHLKAKDMLNFLEGHPALDHSGVLSKIWLDISLVCSNGFIQPFKGKQSIYWSPKNYKRFKKEFDKEYATYSEAEKRTMPMRLVSIDVPYKDLFGEEWKADHIEYWGELCFNVFRGPFQKDYDPKNWMNYSGVHAGGRTFEELIVNIGTKFKKAFGNYDAYDFLTEEEKKNNKGKMPFFFVPYKGKDKKLEGMSTMERNKEYKNVSKGELNRRWLKWFVQTPYGKKNWPDEFKGLLKGHVDKNGPK